MAWQNKWQKWGNQDGEGGGGGGGWQSQEQDKSNRVRLSEKSFAGRVITWKSQYGWIEPLTPIDHPEMALSNEKHWGHIYVHSNDVNGKWKTLKVGSVVEFYLYKDGTGLGAEECLVRKVVRMTLPHDAAAKSLGEQGVGIQSLEDKTNTSMRVYQWMLADGSDSGLPFLLVEVWGRPQAIVDCVTQIGVGAGGGGEKEDEEEEKKEEGEEEKKKKKKSKRYQVHMLVPESRLTRLNMEQLNKECKSAALSESFAIIDPMPCRTLTLTGKNAEIQTALWSLISYICED